MDKRESDALEEEARGVVCPGCGAEVGKPCRAIVVEGGAQDRPVVAAHQVRRDAAARGGGEVRRGSLAQREEER